MPERTHRFGPFTFDAGQRLLYRDGGLVPLMPKTADLLAALLERRGQVVGKEDLFRLVWPDAHVEETGLARNISLLRKALGDEGPDSRYIETIPKRGYRFLAEESPADPLEVRRSVRRLIGTGIALAGCAALLFLVWWQFYRPSRFVASTPGAPRVAVIPFECSGGMLCSPVFGRPFEGMLVAGLAQSGRFSLLSPSTVHRYVDNRIPTALMGRLLGLDALLEGCVTELGAQVRIVARLSDVHSGRLIWSESFDLPATDPAQAQQEAARKIASHVAAALLRHSAPGN